MVFEIVLIQLEKVLSAEEFDDAVSLFISCFVLIIIVDLEHFIFHVLFLYVTGLNDLLLTIKISPAEHKKKLSHVGQARVYDT